MTPDCSRSSWPRRAPTALGDDRDGQAGREGVRDHGRRRRHRPRGRAPLLGRRRHRLRRRRDGRGRGGCSRRLPGRVLPRRRRLGRGQRASALRRRGRAVRRHRRPLQQRGRDARGRRLDPRHGARCVGSRPVDQRPRRLPLLQARDPSPDRARGRVGDQRRLVRRARRSSHLADLVHGVEGRRALDEPRAGRAVRETGRTRERALPRTGRDPAPHAPVRGDARGHTSAVACICRWEGSRRRRRSPTERSFSRATSRRT